MHTDERAQAHAIEALAAVAIVMSVLVLAQTFILPPGTVFTGATAATEGDRVDGVLESAAHTESSAPNPVSGTGNLSVLKYAVLDWDSANQTFTTAGGAGSRGTIPANEFGDRLAQAFPAGTGLNVYVTFEGETGSPEEVMMVESGTPTSNSVSRTQRVVIYDDDPITTNGSGESTVSTSAFYAPDTHESEVYTVVEVTVVVWSG